MLEKIMDEISEFIEKEMADDQKDAEKYAKEFIDKKREDLERLSGLYKSGSLTGEEFRHLIQGKKDVIEIETLKQAGMAAVKAMKFRAKLLDIITKSVLALIDRLTRRS